jgi:hypothetical protein
VLLIRHLYVDFSVDGILHYITLQLESLEVVLVCHLLAFTTTIIHQSNESINAVDCLTQKTIKRCRPSVNLRS